MDGCAHRELIAFLLDLLLGYEHVDGLAIVVGFEEPLLRQRYRDVCLLVAEARDLAAPRCESGCREHLADSARTGCVLLESKATRQILDTFFQLPGLKVHLAAHVVSDRAI